MFKHSLSLACIMLTLLCPPKLLAKTWFSIDETKEVSITTDLLNGQKFAVTDKEGAHVFSLNGWDMHPIALTDMERDTYAYVKFELVTDADTDVEGPIYKLSLYNDHDTQYHFWSGPGYLNFQPGTASVIFALGSSPEQYGQDGKNLGIWTVTYEEGQGYAIENVARRGEYISPQSANPITGKTYIRLFSEFHKEFEYAVEEGTYYIQNTETGQFLSNGAMWGTRATLSHDGITYNVLHDTSSDRCILKSNIKGADNALRPSDGFNDQSGAWDIVPTTGGVYMYNGSQYFSYTDSYIPQFVNTPTTGSVWKFVTEEQRAAELATDMLTASFSNEVEASYFIKKSDFLMNDPRPKAWSIEKIGGNGGSNCNAPSSGNNESWAAGNVDFYQTLSGLPAGKYKLTAHAYYRQHGANAAGADAYENGAEVLPELYAGDYNVKIVSVYSVAKTEAEGGFVKEVTATSGNKYYIPDNQGNADDCFATGAYLNTLEDITVHEGDDLRIGIRRTGGKQNDWIVFDQVHLYYYGKTLKSSAENLSYGGTLTADTWYKYDILTDGLYIVDASNLSNIVYTTNGNQNLSEATGTTLAGEMELSAGTYYIKSSSTQSLTITPFVKTYSLGTATTNIADGNYVNSLTSLVLTYADAETNDVDATLHILNESAKATLKQGETLIANGTLTANHSAKTLTATFEEVELDLSSSYTINITAGVFGYNSEHANAATSITINTGTIKDGIVFLKDNNSGMYITGAESWNTRACAMPLGEPFTASLQADGTYTLKNCMWNGYIGDISNPYTDNSANPGSFEITKVEGGYTLYNTHENVQRYMNVGSEKGTYGYYATYDATATTVWSLLSRTEYDEAISQTKDAEASSIATKAGLGISTHNALNGLIKGDTYFAIDETSAIVNPNDPSKVDGWTKIDGRDYDKISTEAGTGWEVWNAAGGATQTITGLQEGLYEVTVVATWRPGNKDKGIEIGADASAPAYIFATTSETENRTKLLDWFTIDTNVNNRGNLRDKQDQFINRVLVYVPADGKLTIGIYSPTYLSYAWMPWRNWTLTRYEKKATNEDYIALNTAIATARTKNLGFVENEYAPYNNVEAIKALLQAGAIDQTTNNPQRFVQQATTALSSAVWTANTTEVNAIYDGTFGEYAYNENGSNEQTIGWTGDSGHDNATNVRHMYGTGNAGLSATSSGEAMFIKFGASYGKTAGYTMPLKANTVYRLTFSYGGWNETGTKDLTVTCPDKSTINLTPKTVTAKDNKGHTNPESWMTYTGVFTTTEAGDYVLNFVHKGNFGSQNQLVFGDIELKKAPVATANMVVTDAQWGTFIAPFDVTVPDGVTASTVESMTGDMLMLTEVEDNVIPANTPVVLYSETACSHSFNGQDQSFKESYSYGMLTGTYTDIEAPNGSYILQKQGEDVGFYQVYTEQAQPHVKPGRAYLQLPAGTSSVRRFLLFTDGETGIDGVLADSDRIIYDLSGRRVSDTKRGGIYIINGKKTAVKK